MKLNHLIAVAVTSTACLISSAHAATITELEDVDAVRVQDLGEDGVGDSIAANFLFIGGTDTVDLHPVYVFQMTGTNSGANITNADFDISQTGIFGPSFNDISVIALRTSSSASVLITDYESAGTTLDTFDGTTNGLKSLDVGGETALTSYLQTNWLENDYLFFTLRGVSTIPYPDTGGNNGYIYGNSSGGWTAGSTDAKLTVTATAVPEPSSAAVLGLVGLALILRQRK